MLVAVVMDLTVDCPGECAGGGGAWLGRLQARLLQLQQHQQLLYSEKVKKNKTIKPSIEYINHLARFPTIKGCRIQDQSEWDIIILFSVEYYVFP